MNEREAELQAKKEHAKLNAAIYKDGAQGPTSIYNAAQCAGPSTNLSGQGALDSEIRQGIVQRARMIVSEHKYNTPRAERAAELLFLTERHPEFARFFDLANQL